MSLRWYHHFILAAASLACARVCTGRRGRIQAGRSYCIIGNTLADRMQHDGWLETYLQSRFPEHELSIRNLGFSGDELTHPAPLGRLRHARRVADHERRPTSSSPSSATTSRSPARRASPSSRRTSTPSSSTRSPRSTTARRAPRLVLFSPIAHENLHDRNLPDGTENNERLDALHRGDGRGRQGQRACRSSTCSTRRSELYAKAAKPLTINGIHLTDRGQPACSPRSSTRPSSPASRRSSATPQALEKLRQAVLDKNFYWFNRYRTVDGYSIYGGRADLQFVDGQTNRVVVQREMEVLDVMTANRDRRIWAVAQGKRPEGRRPQHAAVHPGQDQQARHRARTASTSSSTARKRSAR